MKSIRHRIGVKTSLREAYDASHHPVLLAGWWAAAARGSTNVGDEVTLEFPGYPEHVWRIAALEPERRVVLELCSGPDPWKDSALRFDLAESDEQVWITLTHDLGPAVPDEAHQFFCTKWPLFLVSLKALLETGEGMPYPNDIKIQH